MMVQLVKITEEDYKKWLAEEIVAYAYDKTESGAWPAVEALERSRRAFLQLLPDGLESEDQYIYSIYDETLGKNVGVLWFANVDFHWRRVAYVYDIVIDEPYRRQGYGRQAMLALEEKVREVGLDAIELHVFGHNPGAQALYEKV